MRSTGRRRHWASRYRALWGVTVAAVLVVLVTAACSSSGSSSGSAGASGTSSGAAASGSPIVLYGVTTYNNPALSIPEVNDGAQAAAKAINAAGGIKGHPLQVTICDDNFNPNQAQACAE